MSVFRNVFFVAALAGLAAGVVLTALQIVFAVPLILQAETYEAAETQHHDSTASESNVGVNAAVQGHTHDRATAHDHDEEAWQPADGFKRYAFTAAANLISGVGFALLLVAASEFAGGLTGWRQGLLWGLAGFAVFTLAPGLGLPPELPAMPAADLESRQIWWWATVLATAAGIGLLAFSRSWAWSAAAVAVIVSPHLIGAPQPLDYGTTVPEDLHHQFVVTVTIANFVFWTALGASAGAMRSRFLAAAPELRSGFA
ncbi:CbtA family protein [Aminobacter sp. MSH1]|uniref:CbtA family protein n=1 Tax=Aminobacter sp. MSH1 TaxID=374606 RepID=UPI000D36F92F|nr:CbtA family protein [Aminobacter sp. MSH1]